jgi:putative signal transducing protein
MAEERVVVYTACEGRDADILIMQLSRAGIEAAKAPDQESDQAPRWQVSVSGRDEYHARKIVGQFEQDRQDVAQPGAGSGQGDDSLHNPTTVYSASSVQQAHFLKNLLTETGINAMVSNELLHRGSGVDLVGLPTAVKVVVAAKDAQTARELALEFDRRTAVLVEPEVVYNANSPSEARAVKDALVQAGISAAVGDETMLAGTKVNVFGVAEPIPVIVTRRDVEAARQIIAGGHDFQAASSEAMADLEPGESVIEVPAPWPRCPQCDTRRTTRCPICPTSGTDFEEVDPEFLGSLGLPGNTADTAGGCGSNCSCGQDPQTTAPQSVEAEAAEPPGAETIPPRLALMCPTCDEPFVPEFPRRCEWCGHEFADGYDVEDHIEGEPIPVQAMIVILGLVTLVLMACAYFAWIV